MSIIKKYIGARYVEELIDFFMKNYMIDWKPFYGLSKNLESVPVLFTPEIGRTTFVISRIYHYRQKVEASRLRDYFFQEDTFYHHVSTNALECLQRGGRVSFFHMSAYVAEVAVFCQLQNFPNLHNTLIAAIMCLLDEKLALNFPKTRLRYQTLAKDMDEARNDTVIPEADSVLKNKPYANENQVSNSMISSGESSDDIPPYQSNHTVNTNTKNCQVPNSMMYSGESSCDTRSEYIDPRHELLLPNNTVNINDHSHQVPRLVIPDIVNGISRPSFPQLLPPRSFPNPESMFSRYTYPNVHDPLIQMYPNAQFAPVRSPTSWPSYMYQQHMPEYFHQRPVIPIPRYHPQFRSKFNGIQAPPMSVSFSPKTPEFANSFSSMNDSTKPSSSKNSSCCSTDYTQNSPRLLDLNVNAPQFAHSTVKSAADSLMDGLSETSSESQVNTASDLNDIHSDSSK